MKTGKESMKIVFEGQTHQVDANTLINFLIHYKTIVEAANNELGDGTKKINIKVNAIEKGSFVIDIELVQNAIAALFSSDNVGYLSGLTTIIGGAFALHKRFKGKPVKVNDVDLKIDEPGASVAINNSTINIYNQPVVREAISKSIETADQDLAVEGLRIDSEKGTAVAIDKEEFKDLIYDGFSSEELAPAERIVIDEDAILGITKLSFEKGFRWGFMYKGFRIGITVKDDALMDHINNGARFAKGDQIRVKLEILQRYNTEFRVYENKSYKILDFFDHIQCPDQGKMFD